MNFPEIVSIPMAWFITAFFLLANASGDAPPLDGARENPPTLVVVADPQATPVQKADAPKKKKAPPLDLKAIGTGAVIDLSRTPAGALFEATTLANNKVAWVERAQVDKVLGELELQALFSAEGGGSRVGLGKLLKANMLVLLRAGENPEDKKLKHVEIVVCETQQGLRLAGQTVPLMGSAETTVEELQSILNGALAKLSEKITDVCAVPPFLNQDLDFKYDHLKAAYARILEQHLLQRKGVLVIELAEAQAIAKEAILTGEETKLERRLPLYFLGAFRNEGKDGQRHMALDLKLQRGDTVLGVKLKDRVPSAESPKELAKLADALADKVLSADEIGEFDPRAEIQQLVTRAKAFEQVGNWDESLALLETAVLLDPDQPVIHRQAAITGTLIIQRNLQKSLTFPKEGLYALHHYRRVLEHLEIALRPTEKKAPNPFPKSFTLFPQEYIVAGLKMRNLVFEKPPSEERTALWTEVFKEEQAMSLRLCRLRAHAGAGGESSLLHWAVRTMRGAEKYSMIRDMILDLKDLPLAKERTIAFAKGQFLIVQDPAFPAFVEALARDPHPEIKAAGEFLRKDHAEQLAILAVRKPVQPKEKLRGDVVVQPLKLFGPKPDGGKGASPVGQSRGIGPNLDVVMGGGLFLMKEKGVMNRAWETTELNSFAGRYCYDGRYFWFSVERLNKIPRLFVVDPEDMKRWEFTAEDGVPIVDPASLPDRDAKQVIDMAPLGPGRVCLAGSFGRTWLAVATFGPQAGKTVKVFHEARDAPEANVPDQWMRSTIAFEPIRMFTLTGEKGARRVLIGRKCSDFNVEAHALLVDPDNLKVDVMRDSISPTGLKLAQLHEGALYYIGDGRSDDNRHLLRIAFPDFERKSLMAGLPGFSKLLIAGDEFHIVTEDMEWWQGSLSKRQARPVGFLPPGRVLSLSLSAHYGMLVLQLTNVNDDGQVVREFGKLSQISIAPKKNSN